jgi:hypothetical protein
MMKVIPDCLPELHKSVKHSRQVGPVPAGTSSQNPFGPHDRVSRSENSLYQLYFRGTLH